MRGVILGTVFCFIFWYLVLLAVIANAQEIVATRYIHYYPESTECTNAFNKGVEFFRQHGIALVNDYNSEIDFVCAPCPPAIIRYHAFDVRVPDIAYVQLCGGPEHQAKVAIHELARVFGAFN